VHLRAHVSGDSHVIFGSWVQCEFVATLLTAFIADDDVIQRDVVTSLLIRFLFTRYL